MSQILKQAEAHLEAAVELSPRNARYRVALGEALLLAGDDLGAERHFSIAVNLGSGARVEALWAMTLVRLGDLSSAAGVIDDAIRRNGPYANGYYVQAMCFAAGAEQPDAAFALRQAAKFADQPEFYAAEADQMRFEGPAGLSGFGRPLRGRIVAKFFRGTSGLRRRSSDDADEGPP